MKLRTGRHKYGLVTGLSRRLTSIAASLGAGLWTQSVAAAEGGQIFVDGRLDPKALLQAGGTVGYLIIALSVAMVALIVEHLLSISRKSLMPRAFAEQLNALVSSGQYAQATELCRQKPNYLGFVVAAGLQEAPLGHSAIEKAMEDASLEQAARLMRKIDYLSLIGAVAPMLGLLGTVWGMIQAFAEFAEKANPLPADFAPAISEALVTTLFGLCVAIPASGAYVWFRNRIDEYVSEAALLAVHITSPLKRSLVQRRSAAAARKTSTAQGDSDQVREHRTGISTVPIEQEGEE